MIRVLAALGWLYFVLTIAFIAIGALFGFTR